MLNFGIRGDHARLRFRSVAAASSTESGASSASSVAFVNFAAALRLAGVDERAGHVGLTFEGDRRLGRLVNRRVERLQRGRKAAFQRHDLLRLGPVPLRPTLRPAFRLPEAMRLFSDFFPCLAKPEGRSGGVANEMRRSQVVPPLSQTGEGDHAKHGGGGKS